jgi:hypothetical protein
LTILSRVRGITAGKSMHPSPVAFHMVRLTSAVFAALKFVVSCRIRDANGANTMPDRALAETISLARDRRPR